MKNLIILSALSFGLYAFTGIPSTPTSTSEIAIAASFTLLNDTKEAVSIHTGTGFVTLNKGSKTSVGCHVGKEVRFAESGKKGDLIFKITDDMCGKTIKLSNYIK